MKQKIFTVCATKGGCGKSSSCGALGELAALDGNNTLLVDLDAQCNLSMWYDARLTTPGSYELITGSASLDECIQPLRENLSIVHSTSDISGLRTGPASAKRLSDALRGSQSSFNWILIDTSPALSEGLYNALYASDGAIIPLVSDMPSLQAYYQITDIIRQVQGSNNRPKISGVLLTQYSRRASVNRLYAEAIRDQCKADRVKYLGEVRQCVAIREAQGVQKPLFEWAPKSRAAEDYRAIYSQLRGGKR